MFSRQEKSNGFWIPKKNSLTLYLLLLLNFCSFVAMTSGVFDLIRASLAGGRSFTEFTTLDYLAFAFAGLLLFGFQGVLWLLVITCYSRQPFLTRFVVFGGYLACLSITAGFGFGFWWKLFNSNSETLASTRASVEVTATPLDRAVGRLDSLRQTLEQLKEYSGRKASDEISKGNTCGASGAAPGPRQRLRQNDADRFASISNYVASKLTTVRSRINNFQTSFSRLIVNDPSTVGRSGTSEAFIADLSQQLALATDSVNDLRSDPQLRKYKLALAHRAEQTEFVDGNLRFTCPDPQLASTLNGIVKTVDELPSIESRKISVSQGPKAVAYALVRLWNTVSAVITECRLIYLKECTLPLSAPEVRDRLRAAGAPLGSEISEEKAGIGRDDLLPLGLGIVVDLLILVVGYYRYRRERVPANTHEFVARVNSSFSQVFDRSPRPSERLLPIKAAIFHHWSGQYAAVPVDFRGYTSIRTIIRRLPRWASQSEEPVVSSDGTTIGDRVPTIYEAQYLDNVFTEFKHAGFVKLLGFCGQLFNFVDEESARRSLARQKSIFGNAPSFKIYKFYPYAWDIINSHFTTATASAHASGQGGGEIPSDREDRQRRFDYFPKGYGHEM